MWFLDMRKSLGFSCQCPWRTTSICKFSIRTALKKLFEDSYDIAILLHAFKAGSFWEKCGLSIPYIVIYGGTDLNIDLAYHEKTAVIEKIVTNAIKRVCFTKEFVKLASSRWPSLVQTYQRKRITVERNMTNLNRNLNSILSSIDITPKMYWILRI